MLLGSAIKVRYSLPKVAERNSGEPYCLQSSLPSVPLIFYTEALGTGGSCVQGYQTHSEMKWPLAVFFLFN